MGLLHSTFLFDYNLFRQEVSDLLHELDKGNYWLACARARESVQSIKADKWILHEQGTTLEPSIFEIEFDPASIGPDRVGYCLLVILSTYLRENLPSLGENWVILQRVLQMVGWDDADAELLIEGVPIETLLKPDLKNITLGPRKFNDPYWRWMVPDHARAAGWLPLEELRRLRYQLLGTKHLLKGFDFTRYPYIQVTNPVVIRDHQQRLQTAHTNVLALLLAAEAANTGLFIVIS
jgi:hypothetical protein